MSLKPHQGAFRPSYPPEYSVSPLLPLAQNSVRPSYPSPDRGSLIVSKKISFRPSYPSPIRSSSSQETSFRPSYPIIYSAGFSQLPYLDIAGDDFLGKRR